MNNISRILNALDDYNGELESLNALTAALKEELGDDWTTTFREKLGKISSAQQEKLDHAFNYYAAVTAWDEIQGYLTAEKPLNIQEVSDRIPVLEHWLSFFGIPGEEAIIQLQEKLEKQKNDGTPSPFSASDSFPEGALEEKAADVLEDTLDEEASAEVPETPLEIENEAEEVEEAARVSPDETREELADEEMPIDSERIGASALDADENTAEVPAEAAAPILPGSGGSMLENDQWEENPEVKEIEDNSPLKIESDGEEATEGSVEEMAQSGAEDVVEEQPSDEMPEAAEEDVVPVETDDSVGDEEEMPGDETIDEDAGESDGEAVVPEEEVKEVAEVVPAQDLKPLSERTEENIFLPPSGMPAHSQNWLVERTFRQLELIHQVQSWIAARCVSLGKIEIFAYKYYGFLIDLSRVVLKDIQAILKDTSLYPSVEAKQKNGIVYLQNNQLYLEREIEIAEENAESDVTPLIEEDLDMGQFKKTMGGIDTSREKEYLGPAPDGFEALDDPYEQEKKAAEKPQPQAPKKVAAQDQEEAAEKTASQTPENSVKKKMSFSFTRPKKPV
ncbi:MAG: hypothetical protein LBU87_01360 [Lactobacillales bacterium]|jgi:hypothetical protein|nr:hypothetical protein [Lactobacillales bacterium]